MLQTERQTFVAQTMAQIDGLLMRDVHWEMHRESLREQFLQTIAIIDRISYATQAPLLLTDWVPGYDLVVARRVADQSPEKAAMPFNGHSLMTIDERNLDLLSAIFDSLFKSIQQETAVFSSADGTHYVCFKSSYRDAALDAMGIAKDGVINVFETQGGGVQ